MAGMGQFEMPEWKKDAFGKAPTFGQRSNLSITQQRESLPIFKLRDELIKVSQMVLIYCFAFDVVTANMDACKHASRGYLLGYDPHPVGSRPHHLCTPTHLTLSQSALMPSDIRRTEV